LPQSGATPSQADTTPRLRYTAFRVDGDGEVITTLERFVFLVDISIFLDGSVPVSDLHHLSAKAQ